MKKILKHSALLLSTQQLCLWAQKKKSDNGTASNSNFEVSVKDGMFCVTKDEDSSSSYFALQVEIKNNRDKQFSLLAKILRFINEKDEKLRLNQFKIYESDSKTEFIT